MLDLNWNSKLYTLNSIMNRIKHYIKIPIIFGVVLFVFAWTNVQNTKIGYSIEKLRGEIERIETKNQYLKKEIQSILSAEKLQAQAKKLGMIYPEPESITVIPETSRKKNKTKNLFARFFNAADAYRCLKANLVRELKLSNN